MTGNDFYNIHDDFDQVKALAFNVAYRPISLVIRAKVDIYGSS